MLHAMFVDVAKAVSPAVLKLTSRTVLLQYIETVPRS